MRHPFTWVAFLLLCLMVILVNGEWRQQASTTSHFQRGYDLTEGVFETIRVHNSQVELAALHLDRMTAGIRALNIATKIPIQLSAFTSAILGVCEKNHCLHQARVRVSVGKNDAGTIEHVIEAFPLDSQTFAFNERGWDIGICEGVRLPKREFSFLKLIGDPIYIKARQQAADQGWDEAILLNEEGHITDGSITNLFIVVDNELSTPPLVDGCVGGVMRKYLLAQFDIHDIKCHERSISVTDLKKAEEIFLTNSIRGVKWVKEYKGKTLQSIIAHKIYQSILQTKQEDGC